MPILSMRYTTHPHGRETRYQFIGMDNRGQDQKAGTVVTTDPSYNPDDHIAEMQIKIERMLGEQDVATWMADMTTTPSLEYATRQQYEDVLDEEQLKVTAVDDVTTTRQAEITANEDKVRA